MKINFRQPRYILPLITLPFALLLFYVYTQFSSPPQQSIAEEGSLQEQLAEVSEEVKNRTLADKLASYREQYRHGDGYTAIGQIQEEKADSYRFDELYNSSEKRTLDSMEKRYGSSIPSSIADINSSAMEPDDDLQGIITQLATAEMAPTSGQSPIDPMELFKKQMSFADSLAKANDPNIQAEQQKQKRIEDLQKEADQNPALQVARMENTDTRFNTIRPSPPSSFIQAIVDQNSKSFVDSRLRLRLLDDLLIGGTVIKSGTHLYAKVTGFSGQRIMLSVRSIFHHERILPVHLDLYDNDGAIGLYVPASAFRELARDMGGTTSQGINLQQQAEGDNRLVMGTLQKMFQSTTTAVSKHIRKNKASLKYGTLVYLIDPAHVRGQRP